MKIFKKIGIGCLVLVICFCSCFKFVNAETIDILDEPFKFVNGTYELYIDESYLSDDNTLIAYALKGNLSANISFLGNNLNIIEIEGTAISTEVSLTYLRDFTNIFNNVTYKVYSFEFNSTNDDLLSLEFLYDDKTINYLSLISSDNDNNGFSVYDTIYNLIETFIFGGSIEVGSHQDLTATILSSIICVLVFALPFLIIWKVIKVIMG